MDLAPGTTIAGRYRIVRRAWDDAVGGAFEAHDGVLERRVLVQAFPPAAAGAVSRAVAAAAQVTNPALCQIYDVSADPPAIVYEHAAGGRLADRKEGALAPPQAAAAVSQLAAAIAALHAHGLAHGAVGPATVLFDEEGRPKLAGAGLAAELGDAVPASPPGYRPREDDATLEESDRYGLAAVAYRLFTGRAPGAGAPPPRSVRRAIPAEVDELLSRALGYDPAQRPSLEEIRRVLAPLAAVEPPERGPGFFRQEARWLVPVLVVIGLAVAAVAVGVQRIATRGGGTTSPGPTASPTALAVAAVEDFDPRPEGNGEEHPEQTRFAIDGKDAAWSTVGYTSADLGRQKDGVGLLFDLGAARRVARIGVRTPFPGWTAEWRVADTPGAQASDFRVVARFTATGDPVTLPAATSSRYWLLWITRLVDTGAGGPFPFQAQVSEITFLAG